MEELWGFPVPARPGLTAPEMLEAAERDELDVLWNNTIGYLEEANLERIKAYGGRAKRGEALFRTPRPVVDPSGEFPSGTGVACATCHSGPFLTDNKASCESTNGARAGLVIRDAVDRDAWVSDPDKGADPSVYTTEAHKGIFITVQAGEGSTAADIQELGASLVWSVD